MRTSALVTRDVNVFIFSENDRFVMKATTKKKRKRNDRFLKVLF